MRDFFHILLVSGVLLATLTPVVTMAEEEVGLARVLVHSSSTPVSAVGFVIARAKAIQVAKPTLTPLGDDRYEVAFEYPPAKVPAGTVATAMIVAEDGSTRYGNTIPLRRKEMNNPLLELPVCKPDSKLDIQVATKYFGDVEQLISIRERRRENSRSIITDLMSPNFLLRLHKLEEAFGLNYGSKLSPEMSPMVLNDRLGRLLHALNAIRIKNQTMAATPSGK